MPTMTFTATQLPSAVPTSAPTATLAPRCDEKAGKLEMTNYSGVVSEDEVQVTVYLPACYGQSTERYPVIYALHGYPLDETHWQQLGVIKVVDKGIQNKSWGPFIIVMPRIPDYLNVRTDGGPGSFEQELVEGLRPFIDRRYRTRNGAAFNALAGVSRGAVWALEIGLRNGDRFGTVAAISPALHVNRPRIAYDPFLLALEDGNFPERIFVSVGDSEAGFRQKTEEFVQILVQNNFDITFLLTTGEHVNATFAGVIAEVIEFIAAQW